MSRAIVDGCREDDSGDYGFPYVTRWAKGSTDLVNETAERAIVCAKSILAVLEAPALEQASLKCWALHVIIYNHMVVDKAKPDRLFHALADATRRDIVMRAMTTELSVSALARLYPMSFAAVQKHVDVLERAGLVTKRRRGRERLVRGNRAAIAETRRHLDRFEERWRERIDRAEQVLKSEGGER